MKITKEKKPNSYEKKGYIIEIEKNTNGDTRTAKKDVTFEEFQKANDMHIKDVKTVMGALSTMLDQAGKNHDRTKKSAEKQFYADFKDTMENGSNFVEGDWYKMHCSTERHHLLSDCPDNVDLLDVIEMIVDCVCAGKARSGDVRPPEINDDILKKAFKNTVGLVDKMTKLK